MTKIEVDVLGSTPDKSQTHSLVSTSVYSLADLFQKINPENKHFLKYVPDGFLNDEQLRAKMIAIQEDNARIASYEKKRTSQRDLHSRNSNSDSGTGIKPSTRDTLSNREVLERAYEVVDRQKITDGSGTP